MSLFSNYDITHCMISCRNWRLSLLFFYRGTSGIDIALQKIDIDQCPSSTDGNVFANSSRCKPSTTKVSAGIMLDFIFYNISKYAIIAFKLIFLIQINNVLRWRIKELCEKIIISLYIWVILTDIDSCVVRAWFRYSWICPKWAREQSLSLCATSIFQLTITIYQFIYIYIYVYIYINLKNIIVLWSEVFHISD